MTPRAPSLVLVVDANIILSAALGLRSRPTFEAVAVERDLLLSSMAQEEVAHNAEKARLAGARDAPYVAARIVELVRVIDHALYADRLARAAQVLRLSVASRSGSESDAHILALAWTFNADIWSHDRDFAGTGWPSWSSANLRAAL